MVLTQGSPFIANTRCAILNTVEQKSKNLLLWLGVLPGAILGALLATFPLHWILVGTLYNSSFIQADSIDALRAVEAFLTPFVISGVFVLIGAYIAPTKKFETALALAGLYLLGFVAMILFVEESYIKLSGVFGILGSWLATAYVWKKYHFEKSVDTQDISEGKNGANHTNK